MSGIANSNLDLLNSNNSFVQPSQEQGSLQGKLVSTLSKSGSYIIQSINHVVQSVLSKCIYIASLGRYTLSDVKNYLFASSLANNLSNGVNSENSEGVHLRSAPPPPPPPPPLPSFEQSSTLKRNTEIAQANYTNTRLSTQSVHSTLLENDNLKTQQNNSRQSTIPSAWHMSQEKVMDTEGNLASSIIQEEPLKKSKNNFMGFTMSDITNGLKNLKQTKTKASIEE